MPQQLVPTGQLHWAVPLVLSKSCEKGPSPTFSFCGFLVFLNKPPLWPGPFVLWAKATPVLGQGSVNSDFQCSVPIKSMSMCLLHPSLAEYKAIMSGTKSIAVKAARRRSRVLESERLNLLEATKECSRLSLHSLSENEDPLCRETPAACQPPSPSLQHAVSEDNLSSSTGETAPGRNIPRHSPGPWLQASKKGSKKLEKKEESQETKRRKRRSRSFEVTGHRVSFQYPRILLGGTRAPPHQRTLAHQSSKRQPSGCSSLIHQG